MRDTVAVLILAAALTSCGGGLRSNQAPIPPLLPGDQGNGALAVELAKLSVKTLREYIDALLLCGSPQPSDWLEAQRKLDVLHPFHVFKEDLQLTVGLRRGDATCRKELARRGGLLKSMLTFSTKPDKAKWDEARRNLLEGGEAGETLLVSVLLQQLVFGAARDNWEALRYQLVETGKPALETTIELARAIANAAPAESAVFAHDDLIQLFMVLIGFGDLGRPAVEEFAKHVKPNIRRCLAEAVGEARDDQSGPMLADFLRSDPSWIVRAAAAESCRRMGVARRQLGPVLVDRVGKEREGYVVRRVLRAIGDIGWSDGVPVLVGALEAPSLETVDAAIAALYVLTGERFAKREKWEEWYRTRYAVWRSKQPK